MTRHAQKRNFRSCSISEFFNSIDVKRTLRIASTQVTVWGVAGVRLANVTGLNRIHSSGSPALRRPSSSGVKFIEWVCCHLRVSWGLRRRASAKADAASSILPSSA